MKPSGRYRILRKIAAVIAWIGLGLLALVLALAGAVSLYLRTETGQHHLRSLVQTQLSKSLGAEVQIGALHGSLIGGVTLDQVKVTGSNNSSISAEHIDVQYQLPLLLAPIVVISDLQIRGLKVHLMRNSQGRWAFLDNQEQPKADMPKKLGMQRRIIIRHLLFSDARVCLAEKGDTKLSVLDLQQIQMEAGLKFGPAITLQLQHLTLSSISPRAANLKHMSGRLIFLPGKQELMLSDIQIQTAQSNLTLQGKVGFAARDPEFQVKVEATAFTPSEWGGALPGTIGGHLMLQGKPDDLQHRAELTLDALHWRSSGRITGLQTGRIGLNAEASVRKFNPTAKPLVLPQKWRGALNLDLTLIGKDLNTPERSLETEVVLLPSHLGGMALDQGRCRLRLHHQDVYLEDGHLTFVHGKVNLAAAAVNILNKDHPTQLKMNMQMEEVNIQPWAGIDSRLNGRISATAVMSALSSDGFLQPKTAQLEIDLETGRIAETAIESVNLNASWDGTQVLIQNFNLSSTAGCVSLIGHLGAKALDVQLDSTIQLADVAAIWKGDTIPNIAGRLTAKGRLYGTYADPMALVDGTVADLKFDSGSVEQIRYQATWQGLAPSFQLTAKGAMKMVRKGKHHLPVVDYDVTATPHALSGKINAMIGDQIQTHLDGTLSNWRDQQKTALLQRLWIRQKDLKVENTEPIYLTIAPDALEIRSLNLAAGSMRLSGQGRLQPDGHSELRLTADNVDLAQIGRFWPGGRQWQGQAHGQMAITGKLDDPTIDLALSLQEGRLILSASDDKSLIVPTITASSSYKRGRGTLALRMSDSSGPIANAHGTFSADLSLWPWHFNTDEDKLNLEIVTQQLPLEALPLPAHDKIQTKGLLTVNAQLSGSWRQPQIEGRLVIENGALSLIQPELSYENAVVRVRFDHHRIYVDALTLSGDTEGQINAQGIVAWHPWVFDLKIMGKDVRIPYGKALTARVDPDLHLSGTWDAPQINGRVEVRQNLLNLDRLETQGPTEIEVIADETAADTLELGNDAASELDLWKHLAADVQVNAPNNTWLRGKGLNAEIQGQVRMQKAAGQPATLNGTLSTLRGFYLFRGRRFMLNKGTVTFIGLKEPNPNLDIEGVYKVKTVQIIARIGGTARNIVLSLESEPPMDQADILAYLIFGRTTDQMKSSEAQNSSQAALSITGKMTAERLSEIFGDALALDTIYIDPGGEDLGQSTLNMGKYVRPDVFVTYRQSIDQHQQNELEVIYEISRHLNLETQIGNDRNYGLDLFWKYDY